MHQFLAWLAVPGFFLWGHLKWNCWLGWPRLVTWLAGHPTVCQFPEPCHELPPAQLRPSTHSSNWINPLILLVDNINVSLIKLHAPASFVPFAFCPLLLFSVPAGGELASWCPTCVRTCADTCTPIPNPSSSPMCLVTLFHQTAHDDTSRWHLGQAGVCCCSSAGFSGCFPFYFLFFWYPKSLLCVRSYTSRTSQEWVTWEIFWGPINACNTWKNVVRNKACFGGI